MRLAIVLSKLMVVYGSFPSKSVIDPHQMALFLGCHLLNNFTLNPLTPTPSCTKSKPTKRALSAHSSNNHQTAVLTATHISVKMAEFTVTSPLNSSARNKIGRFNIEKPASCNSLVSNVTVTIVATSMGGVVVLKCTQHSSTNIATITSPTM